MICDSEPSVRSIVRVRIHVAGVQVNYNRYTKYASHTGDSYTQAPFFGRLGNKKTQKTGLTLFWPDSISGLLLSPIVRSKRLAG